MTGLYTILAVLAFVQSIAAAPAFFGYGSISFPTMILSSIPFTYTDGPTGTGSK